MRTLLALVLRLISPARGCDQEKGPQPAVQAPPCPHSTAAAPIAADDLRGEDVALVRPYVVAWERHVARELEEAWHRERRAADSLAAMRGAFLGVPA